MKCPPVGDVRARAVHIIYFVFHTSKGFTRSRLHLVAPLAQSSESYARSSSTTTIGGGGGNDASTTNGGGVVAITAVAATRNERCAGVVVVAAVDPLERTECAGGDGMGEIAAAEPVSWC